MKKSQQIQFQFHGKSRKDKMLSKLQRIIFSVKSAHNFEVFEFANPIHDELQIVYANLRV